jgi:hypothetical protein
MLMILEEKMIKRILVGLAVFIVVVFIVWRWRTKSEYIYPEATPVGTFNVTAITNVAATATLPGYMKVTTGTTAHGFVASGSARDTVIFKGFTGTSVALNSPKQFILYNAAGLSTSEFAVLIPPTITPAFNTGITVQTGYANYKNSLQNAVDIYNQALTDSTLGIYISPATTKSASDALALTTKNSSYQTASEQYVQNKCPYGKAGPTDYLEISGKPGITNDPAITEYNKYRLTSGRGISKIQNDYNPIITASSSAAVTGTPLNYYANTLAVQQARKADITGATRAYLSAVCPGFYTDVTGSTVEATYKSWDIGATPYGYNAPTQTKLNNWATYAIDTSISGAINTDGKLVLSIARDLKGAALTAGGVAPKPAIIGSPVTSLSGITSVTGGASTATITTPTAHGLANGSSVIMAGFSPDALNGTFVITVSAATPTVFTIPLVSAPAHTTLGTITPLVAASTTTSNCLVVYTVGTGPTAISKPAWQWARDFGPGTVATTLLPTALQGWATPAPIMTTSMLIDTTMYV